MNGPSSFTSFSSCSRSWSLLNDFDWGWPSESRLANILPDSVKTFGAPDWSVSSSAKFWTIFSLHSLELTSSSSPPMGLSVTMLSAGIGWFPANWQLLNSCSLPEQFSLVRLSSSTSMVLPVGVGIELLSDCGASFSLSLPFTSTACSPSFRKSRKA